MTTTLDFPILGTSNTIQDIEDLWNESEDDVPCENDAKGCDKSAQVMVLWSRCCPRLNRKNYFCLGCLDYWWTDKRGLRLDRREASCHYCKAVIAIEYVTTIR